MQRWSSILAFVVAVSVASPTRADDGGEGQERAREVFKEGQNLFRRGKYAPALESFHRAYGLWRHRVILYNMALAHAMLGDRIAAVSRIREFLKQAPPSERNVPEVLQRLQGEVGVLMVQADPQARIFVDGVEAGLGRVEKVVEPGERRVEVRLGRRVVARRRIDVPAGQEKVWEVAVVEEKPFRAATARGDRRLHWAYAISAAGITVVALGTAIGAGARALELNQDFLATRTDARLRERGMRYQDAANALWGVTATVAVVTVVLAILTRWPRQRKEWLGGVRAFPVLATDGASLCLTGRF